MKTLYECQQFALGQFLNEWPENASYKDIINAMELSMLDANAMLIENIILAEPYDQCSESTVATYIDDYLWSLLRFLGIEAI